MIFVSKVQKLLYLPVVAVSLRASVFSVKFINMSHGIPSAVLSSFRQKFEADSKNRLAQNTCVKHDILEVMRSPQAETTQHIYNHKIETEGKPVSDQKSSGRCWIFAMLNCMRLPFMKQLKIEEFEFSQNYIFFWDRIERLHYALKVFVETARRGEPVDGRLVQHLLRHPSEDGGQWQMLVNLVTKHGVVPKKCFPDAWSSENTRQLGLIGNNKMREYCKILRAMVVADRSEHDVNAEIERMMEEIYRITSICIGSPPETFTFEYYDKDKQYHKIGPITPIEFYNEHVKPVYNIADKVVIVNDPRPDNPYDRLYTVEYLNNMSGSPLVLYINKPAELLKEVAFQSICANEPVWFGCDVGKRCSWKKFGLEDLNLYNYELVFGVTADGLSKAERLIFGESLMTHAMVLTAVHDQGGQTKKWRIENSWSETGGDKGYMSMTDDWFTEYVFEVVVDKKFLTAETLAILDQQPKVLPAWDPMGALAGCRCASNISPLFPQSHL